MSNASSKIAVDVVEQEILKVRCVGVRIIIEEGNLRLTNNNKEYQFLAVDKRYSDDPEEPISVTSGPFPLYKTMYILGETYELLVEKVVHTYQYEVYRVAS